MNAQEQNPTGDTSAQTSIDSESKRRIKNLLLNLARRAQVSDEAANTLSNILAVRLAENWKPAFEAAMETSNSSEVASVHQTIDEVIARSIREKPDLQLVSDLYNNIPLDTVSLKQTALEVYRQTVRAMEERGRVELYPVEYSTLALNLVARLDQVGEYAEAEVLAKRMVEFCRTRFANEPEKFKDALATSLESYAVTTSNQGKLEDSRKAREESVKMWRAIPESDRHLAQSLNNLAGTLKSMGDFDNALKASQESVDIYRKVVERTNPAQSTNYKSGLDAWVNDPRPQFGQALVGLSSHQNDLKMRAECFASAKEGYVLFQKLNGDYPDQFGFHFGMAVHNLGMADFGLNDMVAGLHHMKEAAVIMEPLAKGQPKAYLPSYAHVLNSVTIAYYQLQRIDEAVESAKACVAAYQKLNALAPGIYTKMLGESLDNLRVLYEQQGSKELAAKTAAMMKELELPEDPSTA
jgi:tetratricopeptide (TPR) repeat protein